MGLRHPVVLYSVDDVYDRWMCMVVLYSASLHCVYGSALPYNEYSVCGSALQCRL